MASHQRSLDIDPSLKNLVRSWESSKDKVRRPPNAFMLFGKDHRNRLAQENPDVSNKVISEMLGKTWREAPSHIKDEYYNKARIMRSLHANMFPGYNYSPVEARRKKAEKRKKCTEAVRILRGESPEEKARKEERNSLGYWTPRQDKRRERNSQEGMNDPRKNKRDKKAGNFYRKLNKKRCHGACHASKFMQVWLQKDENGTGGLNDEVAGVEYVPNNPENVIQFFDEEGAQFSENQQTDLDASLRGHESGPSRSEPHVYCSPSYTIGVSSPSIPSKLFSPYCSPKEECPGSTSSDSYENTAPQYCPCCNSRLLRAPLSYQMRDDSHQGLRTVPYSTSRQYRPSLGHQFDRSAIPYYISEFTAQNPQAGGYSRDEGLSNSYKSSNDGLFLGPSYLTSGYLPSFIPFAPKEETSKDSFESDDGSLEIDVENETSSSCDSESETAQATNLIHDELSMPTLESLVSFGGLVSSAIRDGESRNSFPINNEITNINSKSDNEAETEIVVKEHGVPDISYKYSFK